MIPFERIHLTLLLALLLPGPIRAQSDPSPHPGLILTLAPNRSALAGSHPNASVDASITPAVRLYTAADQSPSPFLPPGPFVAQWTGHISVDLRSDMLFQAEVRGHFTLTLNGEMVLDHTGDGRPSPISAPVRLNKGTNALMAVLTSPPDGDTSVRLLWGEQETLMNPVPPNALSHATEAHAELIAEAEMRRAGRELALDLRCFQCHDPGVQQGNPELAMDAPSFVGIGNRRREDWMRRWILDPSALRPSARMPRLLHGPGGGAGAGEQDAKAIAAYLSTLTDGGDVVFRERQTGNAEAARDPAAEPGTGTMSAVESVLGPRPETLFEALHCQACHTLEPANRVAGKELVSLRDVGAKFTPGKLAEFLRKPDAHYRWIRMPDFHLAQAEADELAAHLLGATDAGGEGSEHEATARTRRNASLVDRGRDLIQSTGCLNCHTLNLENRFVAPRWTALERWESGCLADAPGAGGSAPRYALTAGEARAIRAFAKQGIDPLRRHVPSEFAARQVRQLRCAACHGAFEGFPPWTRLGEQLKPEWMTGFLAGELTYRPRPWLYGRMPAFAVHAAHLGPGLAMLHGYPPRTPPEPARDETLARIGRQLVGKEGGFSCVSCHGIGSMKAQEVFEAEGINLSHVADRLQKAYYQRWMLNPTLVEPQTKMPVYFDQGLSPLTEILEGDAGGQIEAIWHYLRLKDQMSPPDMDGNP